MRKSSAVIGSSTWICSRSANSGIEMIQFVSCTNEDPTTCSSIFVTFSLQAKSNCSEWLTLPRLILGQFVHWKLLVFTRFSREASQFPQCHRNGARSFGVLESSACNRRRSNLRWANSMLCKITDMWDFNGSHFVELVGFVNVIAL